MKSMHMKSLESRSRKKNRRKNIQKIILGTVAVTGMLTVAAMAPNVIGAMGKLGILPSKRQKEIIKRSRDSLVERGLLEYKDGHLALTAEGQNYLKVMEAKDFVLAKPRRWDKKWRVLIFDIKENRKSLREKLRRTLMSVGFLRLQDSVWIYPYDCEELMSLLKADFNIGKDMLYMIVDELEYDTTIRRHFSLSER
ncbi:MAG: hypothetical protein HYV68_00690 [Candidatus Taylorbacteria bacterium]|nr:hypothetical protein [Candidatus Taylorbacteria bacterium]